MIRKLLILVMLGATAFSFQGCAATPEGRGAQVVDVYATVLDALSDARDDGILSPEDEADAKTMTRAVDAVLDEYAQLLVDGKLDEADAKKAAVRRAMRKLIDWAVREGYFDG